MTFHDVSPGMSRIYLYRVSKFAALLSPEISINNKIVWNSESGAVTYIDLKPGSYIAKSSDYEDYELSFFTYPGETKYLNLGIRPNIWHGKFIPQLVTPEIAEKHIQNLDLVKPNLVDF